MRPWENPWAMAQGHFAPSVQIGPKKKNKWPSQWPVCSLWFSQSLLFCLQNFNIVTLKLIFIIFFTKFQHREIKINFHYFFQKNRFSQSLLFCSQNLNIMRWKLSFIIYLFFKWFSQFPLFCSQNLIIVRLKSIFIKKFHKFWRLWELN